MENTQVPAEIGVLPLRNSVLFPHAIMPISVGRRKTLNLLDDVVRDNKLIGVVSQRNPSEDDPDPAGMYRVGTAARILKVVKLNGNNVNLDQETLSHIDTTMRYQLTLRALDGKYSMLREAIKGA